jgi:small GTP-binding protein
MPRNLIKKICLLGDGEVGKTSLIRKFVYDDFDDKYLMTIGTKITKKTMVLNSGHKQYYRGSKAGIFVCDLTRKSTLERMEWWLDSFNQVVGEVPLILLGNKLDLVEQRQVSENDLAQFARNFNCSYYLTSAKTGENVEHAFEKIGRCLCSTTT